MTVKKPHPTEMVREGVRLVEQHQRADAHHESLKVQLNRARSELTEAEATLGDWMCPSNAKVGETFSIWHGDALLQVTLVSLAAGLGHYKIKWRNGRRATGR